MTELYMISSSPLKDEHVFQRVLGRLPVEEQEKTAQFKSRQRQRVYVCSRLLLQQKLKDRGYQLSDCVSGQYGKLYLKGCRDFYFNLSHSGDMILLGLSDCEIGVDLEQVRKEIPKRLDRILSSDELTFLHSQPEEEQKAVFFRLWTMKEAAVKQKGQRIFDQANQLDMVSEGTFITKREDCFIQTLFLGEWVASVCFREKEICCLQVKDININKLLNI
ncbi:4'-phosphopantetheinyl transferase superfamily protein [Anaerotignum lactatifermentans]|uniref:4'-phosphopantetheinyl transferase superfamily protein n=1 Tax=Anaerotignum lactatifermentans TaxID=160404 RepID=A0ABS2G898_9FIRM|nr:4'-phosphopantetheinyl transferase superfamily protein [Anaerotignum lactatifermentans]MBM6828421.1 4'-phosphopantetheinyl transferase superfamily protein [Anaerotignum lactatifermentans]MBM6877701.1 4'-phosphopantetheinyl transferase superfamily protein [Anaerotignum lactatifermentans]MBM6950004.1 4'-phosphopantetheinyl transferase superfamily protein [Anaerotignum lactatifermentans]